MKSVRATSKGPQVQLTGKALSKKFKKFNEVGGDRVMPWIRQCCEAAKLDPDNSADFINTDGEVMTDGQISTQVDVIRKRHQGKIGTKGMTPEERSKSWYGPFS